MPSPVKTGFTTPMSEAYMSRQITPTTTGAIVMGRISPIRNTLAKRISRATSSASPRPRSVSMVTAIATNRVVVHSACQKTVSWSAAR